MNYSVLPRKERLQEVREGENMSNDKLIITREWAMPNKWTFKLKPIAGLLQKEITEGVWVDPFA